MIFLIKIFPDKARGKKKPPQDLPAKAFICHQYRWLKTFPSAGIIRIRCAWQIKRSDKGSGL